MAKKKLSQEMRDYFAAMGRKGGKLGGRNRWSNMSAAERTQHASAAGKASVLARQRKARAAKEPA